MKNLTPLCWRCLFLLTAATFLMHCTPDEATRWKRHAERVTIYRDDFGVPHIYGKSDADAVFGLIYAQCEDDFRRVERNYLAAIGRLAEVEGESFLYHDLRARLFMTHEEAQELYNRTPPWLQALCQAWADGLNYYLYTHPEVKPALLNRFEPWMVLYFTEGSIGGNIEQISVSRLKNFYEKSHSTALVDNEKPDFLSEPSGSNGFALAGKITASGNAMLLINPHTSFYFRGECHAVSQEGLQVYGAVTWGQFFIYQGFNERLGWMHTSSAADVMDEFIERIEPHGQVLMYRYGEEWRPVIQKEVTLYSRQGDSLHRKSFIIYRTHHGPITHANDTAWVATSMLWDPVRALEQSFRRMKAGSLTEFTEVLKLRTNASNNTVYADADGNIAYFHGNFIPRRNPALDYSKPVDGSDPATDWQGVHEVNETIHLINPPNGWIQNCNSTPFTCALEYSPKKENYPSYMAPDPENFRGIHAVRVLSGKSGFTLDKLIEAAYDPQLPAFEVVIPGLVQALDNKRPKTTGWKAVADTLRSWNYQVSTRSSAMTLAHFYTTRLLQKTTEAAGLLPLERFAYLGNQTSEGERLLTLEEIVQKLESDFGTWAVPWGEVNRFQRLTGNIEQIFDDAQPSLPVGMASGNWGALASFGARGNLPTKRLYGSYGNSFVAVVEFGKRLKAKSVLAGGQSSDPASPHFNDQAERYVNVDFKDVAFYQDEVERRARKKYHPGK